MKQHSTLIKKLSIVNCQLFSYSIILLLFFASPVKAQVTIGKDTIPHKFSILELRTDQVDGGLRLPQLKTTEREALNSQLTGNDAAKGLVVFDTDLNCLEFWNGTDWVSMCSDVLPDCSATVYPLLGSSYTLCANATFSDLTTAVGGKERWYDTATGGAAHADGEPLSPSATYYAEEYVSACVSPTRIPVSVTLGDCTTAPTNGNVTTFTNVMYDFQHQTLEAYGDDGIPTAYRWQVSEDNSAFNDIADAPNSNFYTVPAHFADNYQKNGIDSLFFRCILSNSIGNTTTSSLNILFINTGTSGYSYDVISGDTIRYLTIQTRNFTNFPSGTMKMALLNLGQSGTGAWIRDPNNANVTHIPDDGALNDAGDLGDFYQWGRVADGHEHIVWKKGADYMDSITPMTGDANATSFYVPTGSQTYDDNGQINNDGTDYYGNFICNSTTWGNGNSLWGNGVVADSRATSDIPLSSPPPPITPPSTLLWSYATNNPCPDNWSVPSRWNIWDIFNGDGSDAPPGTYSLPGGDVNTWQQFRLPTNNAIGGVIITNADGEKVFLPAAGFRYYGDALLSDAGAYGYYWCSSVNSSTSAYRLYFGGSGSGNVSPGYAFYSRAYGFSVRCVSE